jgi:hypothetical protein
MYSNEIEQVLSKEEWFQKGFCGVLAINQLSHFKVKTRPCAFIVNTDNENLPGEHWFSIYIPEKGIVEYFDSYGHPPMNKEVYHFLTKITEKWNYNSKRLQNDYSSTCGKYCVIYLIARFKGLTMNEYTNWFSSTDYALNDKITDSIFTRYYNP